MALKIFAAVALLVGVISCEVVQLKTCDKVPANACTIHEVRISPCKETPNACEIKKKRYASISFDYTINFAATKLKTMVYWDNGVIRQPFGGMDGDACKFTPCPAEVGKRRTFDYRLKIGKNNPSGVFPIKWKLWNEDNEEQYCCFDSTIKLKK